MSNGERVRGTNSSYREEQTHLLGWLQGAGGGRGGASRQPVRNYGFPNDPRGEPAPGRRCPPST